MQLGDFSWDLGGGISVFFIFIYCTSSFQNGKWKHTGMHLLLMISTLTHLCPMYPFSTPWKHQKTLKFSRGKERVHWEQNGLRNFISNLFQWYFSLSPLTTNVPQDLETSQLICRAYQLTGAYIMENTGR